MLTSALVLAFYAAVLCVLQALIGVTINENQMLLVNINEDLRAGA